MNSFKLFISCFSAILLFVGCSDSSKVTGTAEETNELAIELSSSSTTPEEISSSSDAQDVSSSSAKVSSSSARSSSSSVASSSSGAESSSSAAVSSSSSKNTGNNDTKSSSSQQIPSSSSATVSSSSVTHSSSSISDGSAISPNTFDKYIAQFGIDSVQFDKAVMATAMIEDEKPGANDSSDTHPPHVFASEFAHVGIHQFVKQNIDAVYYLFPEASRMHADLINAIKNDNADCNLYLFNIYGDEHDVGHIVIDIKADSVTVLDIVANNCKETTRSRLVGFLFSYCGEMEKNPEIERIPVEIDIPSNECPAVEKENEWVK